VLKTLQALRIVRHSGGEHFDGDFTSKPGVGGPIHFPHSAGTDGGSDLIRPETNAGTESPLSMKNMGIVAGLCDSANGCER